MALFRRSPITKRDDAALPHEDVPVPIVLDRTVGYQGADDRADGNSTPNGGI